jgi:SAM-dependent methyltransferase
VVAVPSPALRFLAGSDCTPVRGNVQIGTCPSCALLQKDTGPSWQDLCARIYKHYQIYHQADGTEQKARGSGATQLAPRSELIASRVSQSVAAPKQGSALDIGCGNGAFLQAMMKSFPGWRLTGTDLNETFREQILGLGAQVDFKTQNELERAGETFDLVSLIHCIEHIPSPSQYLRSARRYIKSTGVLLIEVPDAALNPFDLVVADHASHFSKNTVASMIEKAGYELITSGNLVIGKEITVLARPLATENIENAQQHGPPEPEFGRRNLSWLERTIEQAQRLANESKLFGVFGTSIAAVWIASALGQKIAFYVDEDEARIGRDYFDTPILSPSQVPAGATVFVCLEPELAQEIATRHADISRRYVGTPPLH